MSPPFVYDPGRPDFQDQAYSIYRRLREEFPAYHNPDARFWALSRFEDVRRAASDPQTFSSEGTDLSKGLLPQIQAMDPPRHDALRSLASQAFTPRRVARMEGSVRRIARELIGDLVSKPGRDLLESFARQLPSRVIGELIGVPLDRQARFLTWTESMIETPAEGTVAERNLQPARRIYEEFAQLLAERRTQRCDDLMSGLIDAEIDGEKLSEEELLGFCFVLIVAGNDTTTNLIANGAVLLAQHPEQRELLVRDASLIPNAIEEMLRYEAPAQALPRIATRDVELHGVKIPEGSLVRLIWGSANRDEREFSDPDRFDVQRPIRRHLTFGHGVHFCLGANLARLEARVAFEELLERAPLYELEEEPGWITSIWARAHTEVRIRIP